MTKPKWNLATVRDLYELPIPSLLLKAQSVHQQFFCADEMELCTILSIKTGACPEDCAYCPQSGHYQTLVEREKILPLEKVVAQAERAKANGAVRLCMGAAWRSPPKKDLPKVIEMIKAVKEVGLETCVTLGMLNAEEAQTLQHAGLDFYNHNLDTSPAYYKKIITTRTYQDRLDTIDHVANAGLKVCCGGIIGMGETREDRLTLLCELANLPETPQSVPINRLIPFKGTPLANTASLDNFEFIRTIATARVLMPKAVLRLSAGRTIMSEEMQALCFMAGANSMWLGNKLLTAKNPDEDQDLKMLKKFGIKPKKSTPNHLEIRMKKVLQKLTSKNALRIRHSQDNYLINFCSNDYLAIATDARIKKALIAGANKYGLGSGASPVVSGYTNAHQALEETCAAFLQRERALIFNSGFHANLGVLTTLANKNSIILADKFCHASLLDGAYLSRAKFYRYQHQDLQHTELLLQKYQRESLFLVTESVFGMQGNISDIKGLANLAANYQATLIVDDAHGAGILGANGKGICEHYQLNADDVPCLVVPLGKSFGSFGAVVAGNHHLIETLLQTARTYHYSTLLPAALCEATSTVISILQNEPWRRLKVLALSQFFTNEAEKRNLPLISTDETPIKSIRVGANNTALRVQAKLQQQGFFVACIRPPSVPINTARIKISLSCAHSEAQIVRLLDHLKDALSHE